MNRSFLPGLASSVVLALGLLAPDFAQAQATARLAIDLGPASTPDSQGLRTARARIRAVIDDDVPATQIQTNVPIRAEVFLPPGLVISEVALDGSGIEFVNPGTEPLDVSGWLLHAGYGPLETRGAVDQFLPHPTILPPGGILLWTTSTNPPQQVTALISPRPFPKPRPLDIEVRDDDGVLLDQLFLATPENFRERLWNGAPVIPSGAVTLSVTRLGNANRFSAADWSVGQRSLGSPNAGLALPWTGRPVAVPTTPPEVLLTNGTWEGTVSFDAGSSRTWRLAATMPGGFVAISQSQPLLLPPRLTLEWIDGNGIASEAAPGRIGRLRIRIPGNAPAALPVRLELDAPGEFQLPDSVTVPAGAASVEFDVSNLDDPFADGHALVRLTAAAPGFEPASLALLNEDDETGGTLRVLLPGGKPEGAGLVQEPGVVALSDPAQHDIEVRLHSNGRLRAPARVIIPRGSVSARFSLVVEEDEVVNVPPLEDTIRAATGSWPATTASIEVVDNDPVRFRLEIEPTITEGQTNEAVLRFDRTADRPRTVWIETRSPLIQAPASVVLPAGQLEVRFPVSGPENSYAASGPPPLLCVRSDLFTPECRPLSYADNDLPAESVAVILPSFVFGPAPVPARIEIRDTAGRVKPVNGTCRVRVQSPVGEVWLPGEFLDVPISRGVFEGTLPLEGGGERVRLVANFGSIPSGSTQFALIRGRQVAGPIADVATWPGRPSLLALLVQTNGNVPAASLVELDPATGSTLRQLALPAPAHRLAVSSSGATAWLASVSNSVQRVNLGAWAHAGEVALAPTNGTRNAFMIAIAEGTDADVLVMTTPARLPANEPVHLVGIRTGQRLDTPLSLGTPQFGLGQGHSLVALPDGGEFVAVLDKGVRRVRLDAGTVVSLKFRDLLNVPAAYVTMPAVVGNTLVFAGGYVLDTDSLEDRPPFGAANPFPYRTAVLPMPDLGKVLFVDDQSRIQTHDLASKNLEGLMSFREVSHNTPVISRMARWGSRGAALLSWQEQRLFLFDDPIRTPPTADLGVTMSLPPRLTWAGSSNPDNWPLATITVTNRGPDRASTVMYQVAEQTRFGTESLAAGASVEFTARLAPTATGPNRFTVRVSSQATDPAPANNQSTAVTFVDPPAWPGEAVIALDARHLIAKPDGTELWVANGPGVGTEGISLVHPATGAVQRTLPAGPDPRRLSAEDDGSAVYALLGTNRVVRWNFALDALDMDRVFEAEPVLDIAGLPGPGGRLAVLMRNRIVLLSGTNLLQQLFLPANANRTLAAGGGRLLTATGGEVRVYTNTPAGLTFLRTLAFGRPEAQYRFNTDGEWAGFDGLLFNAVTGGQASTEPGGAAILPGPGGVAFNIVSHRLRTLSTPLLLPAGETVIAGNFGSARIEELVRWGSAGFAFRTGSGLIVSVPSAVDRSRQADLAVSVEAVGQPYYFQQSEFRVTVRNQGTGHVSRALVEVTPSGASSITAPPPALHEPQRVLLHVGPLAPGESRELRFTVVPNQQPFPVSNLLLVARALSEGTDPTPADATTNASFEVRAVPANLGVGLAVPDGLRPGQEFEVVCTLTNAGPAAVTNPTLGFVLPTHFEWLGVDVGFAPSPGGGQLNVYNVTPRLDPASQVQVRLKLRANRAGVSVLTAFPSLLHEDPDRRDNHARVSLHVPPDDGDTRHPRFALGFNSGRWSHALQQWVFTDSYGVTLLDPVTLAPTGSLLFEGYSSASFLNPEGSHVWVQNPNGGLQRWNLATRALEQRLPSLNLDTPGTTALAAVPGRPGMLVRFRLEGDSVPVVTVFDGDTALPLTYSDSEIFQWWGHSLQVFASAAGRVYVSNGFQIRELELTQQGVRLLRNLDDIAWGGSRPLFEADNLLLLAPSYVVDLSTLQSTLTGDILLPVADHLAFQFYNVGDGTQTLEAFNTLERAWVYRAGGFPFHPYLPGGRQGLLALGYDGGRVPLAVDQRPDLRLEPTSQPVVLGANREFEVRLALTHADGWKAARVRIQTTLPPGVELTAPVSTGAPGGFDLVPGIESTPIVLRFRASNPGPIRIGIEATAAGGDPTPVDARVALDLVVPPPPVLVLADQVVSDDGTPLQFQLSEAAPETMVFVLVAEHVTTQPQDLRNNRVELTFPRGSRRATVDWVVPDNTVEADEQFRIRRLEGPAPASTVFATITVRNDDRAVLRTVGDTRPEGSSGINPALLTAWLESPIEVPVEAEFTTVDGTAVAGQDFLATTGRLLFSPGNTTNRVGIPIIGDTQYESEERFSIGWGELNGVLWPNAVTRISLLNDDPVPRPELGMTLGADQSAVIRFQSLSGVRYTLESRASALSGAWETEGSTRTGTGTTLEIRPAARPDPTRFYRLRAQ